MRLRRRYSARSGDQTLVIPTGLYFSWFSPFSSSYFLSSFSFASLQKIRIMSSMHDDKQEAAVVDLKLGSTFQRTFRRPCSVWYRNRDFYRTHVHVWGLSKGRHPCDVHFSSNSKTVTWLNFVACPVQCASILSILSTPVLCIHF